MELKGLVTVITGGASGIGETVAKDLASHGVKVVLGDISEDNLKRVCSEIESKGGVATYSVCNVTEEKSVSELMDTAISKFGALNAVIPCAGIIKDALMVSPDKETGKVSKFMSLDDFKKVVDINLTGSFLTLREASIRMIDNKCKGVLFTISSIQRVGGVGQLNYASTKAAVGMWPKLLAGEFHMKNIDYIRIVGIAPGYVATPMVVGMKQEALDKIINNTHTKRLVEPSEIALTIRHCIENDALDATTVEITGGTISGMIAK